MNKLKGFITNLLKEAGADSPYCIARVMAMVSFLSFFVYAGVGLCKGNFDLHGYSSGLMDVLAGCGAILLGKGIAQR